MSLPIPDREPERHEHHERPIDDPAVSVGRRFSGLEGYRGIAAVAIVVFHVYQSVDRRAADHFADKSSVTYTMLHGLDSFVAMFFVLSAFLLALPYMSAALHGHYAPNGRAFLLRRATRVVPLYFVAILIVWSARNPAILGDWVDLVKHLTFTHVYDQERIFYTIGPAWSLAIEVQFYVVLAVGGWLATVITRRLPERWRLPFLVTGVLLLGLASIAWKWWAAYVLEAPGDAWHIWYGLPAKLDEFALGMMLAIVVAQRRWSMGVRSMWITRIIGILVLVVAFATRPPGAHEHLWFHTITAVGFVLILASSVMGPQDRWVRALSMPALAFLGLISYSLYMWHEAVILLFTDQWDFPPADMTGAVIVTLAVVLPVALGVAWLSYHLIEEPMGKLRMLFDRHGRSRDYYNGD